MPLKNFDNVNHRFRSNQEPYRTPRIDMSLAPRRSNISPQEPLRRPVQQSRSLGGSIDNVNRNQMLRDRIRPNVAAASAYGGDTIAAPMPVRRDIPRQRAKRRPRIVTKGRILLLILFIFIFAGGWLATKALSNTLKVFHGNVFGILTTTKLKGEDQGRVNFLLAGNSADDPGHDGANLTDSIMVVSLDTKNNTAFILSIPRDLWVNIPGYGHAKINEAYVDGEVGNFSNPGYPNGGMGLLEEVIHNNFDIPIDYYALIDYNALRGGVNAVGGVDITVKSSDPRGLYDPSIDWTTHGPLVKLTNGIHHLNGEQALDLARARGDAYGSYGFNAADFDRTANQRLMMLALKDKVLTAGTLANPITLSNLFDTLGKNVKTDFTLSEARRAYELGKQVDNSKIVSASLNNANGKNLLANYHSPTKESALIPAAGIDDFGQIQAYIRSLETNDPIAREDASIVVLNGTNTVGLAAKAESALTAKNINVSAIGDAKSTTVVTMIIDASGGQKPATLARLRQIYQGAQVTTTNPYSSIYNANLIVVLGTDQANLAATPTPQQ